MLENNLSDNFSYTIIYASVEKFKHLAFSGLSEQSEQTPEKLKSCLLPLSFVFNEKVLEVQDLFPSPQLCFIKVSIVVMSSGIPM